VLHQSPYSSSTLGVPNSSGHVPLLCPPTVAVHDDGHVLRDF
jgi:hypothetical protein